MRLDALTLGLLLAACTVRSENAASNTPTNAGSDALSNAAGSAANGTAPAPPPAPGAPSAEPSGAISLSAAPASAAAGATMTLTLRNGSRGRAGYNLCTSGLETAAGVAVASDRVCTMELRTLEPRGSATYAYELPERLAPGSYRFVTNVERIGAGTRVVVRSNGFEVR